MVLPSRLATAFDRIVSLCIRSEDCGSNLEEDEEEEVEEEEEEEGEEEEEFSFVFSTVFKLGKLTLKEARFSRSSATVCTETLPLSFFSFVEFLNSIDESLSRFVWNTFSPTDDFLELSTDLHRLKFCFCLTGARSSSIFDSFVSRSFEDGRRGHGNERDILKRASCRFTLGDPDLDLLLLFVGNTRSSSLFSFLPDECSSERRNGENIIRFVLMKTFRVGELEICFLVLVSRLTGTSRSLLDRYSSAESSTGARSIGDLEMLAFSTQPVAVGTTILFRVSSLMTILSKQRWSRDGATVYAVV